MFAVSERNSGRNEYRRPLTVTWLQGIQRNQTVLDPGYMEDDQLFQFLGPLSFTVLQHTWYPAYTGHMQLFSQYHKDSSYTHSSHGCYNRNR